MVKNKLFLTCKTFWTLSQGLTYPEKFTWTTVSNCSVQGNPGIFHNTTTVTLWIIKRATRQAIFYTFAINEPKPWQCKYYKVSSFARVNQRIKCNILTCFGDQHNTGLIHDKDLLAISLHTTQDACMGVWWGNTRSRCQRESPMVLLDHHTNHSQQARSLEHTFHFAN